MNILKIIAAPARAELAQAKAQGLISLRKDPVKVIAPAPLPPLGTVATMPWCKKRKPGHPQSRIVFSPLEALARRRLMTRNSMRKARLKKLKL